MKTVYTFNNKVLKNIANYKWLVKNETPVPPEPPVDPYNPLNLPSNTIRVRTSDGLEPAVIDSTVTLVTGTTDVYDVYKSETSFYQLFDRVSNLVEVLGANTTNITDMSYMFIGCDALTSVSVFDTSNVTSMHCMFNGCNSITSSPFFNTSNVTDMYWMFNGCSSLTSIPLFNTFNVTNMDWMFYGCINVQSGALALYQQASSQTTPPDTHWLTFRNCGSNTETGLAELDQIPSDWK